MQSDIVQRLRQPWFTHGCAEYQHEAADEIERNRAEITRLTEALRAAEERERVLREALVQHNDRLRSAAAVAARDGRETNWLSFRGQVRYTLTEYHELVKESRAELERIADE